MWATSPPRPWTAAGRAGAGSDTIIVDVATGVSDFDVDASELARRRRDWNPLPSRCTRGVLAKYTKLVGSASVGVIWQ